MQSATFPAAARLRSNRRHKACSPSRRQRPIAARQASALFAVPIHGVGEPYRVTTARALLPVECRLELSSASPQPATWRRNWLCEATGPGLQKLKKPLWIASPPRARDVFRAWIRAQDLCRHRATTQEPKGDGVTAKHRLRLPLSTHPDCAVSAQRPQPDLQMAPRLAWWRSRETVCETQLSIWQELARELVVPSHSLHRYFPTPLLPAAERALA